MLLKAFLARSKRMIILRILLIPISLIYGLLMQFRNLFYDIGLFKSQKFSKPVISVGNITAGGTGKTPFTIYLAKLLMGQGKKVAVVSRGYGRETKGFYLVSDGINNIGESKLHGDEPVLISLKVHRAIVAVCEKRKMAIENLLKQFEIDIFILDDAFQHRAVYRNTDILLLQKNTFLNKMVLPSGLLREFYFNVKRAHILITREHNKSGYFTCSYEMVDLFDINLKKVGSLENFERACLAFAGIAHPDSFKNGLREKGINVVKFISFRDHYSFNDRDINFLINQCKSNNATTILCTEKDMVKIREIPDVEESFSQEAIDLCAVGYNIRVTDENSLLKKINLA